MRISDWSSDVCSSDLKSLNFPSSQSSFASSTNHCLNSVSAIFSKVAFWRCSRSILSSKLLRMEAMAVCSGGGGTRIGNSRNEPNEIYGCDEPLLLKSNMYLPIVEVKK